MLLRPALMGPDLGLVNVKAGYVEAGTTEFDRERQPHVSQANHADARAARDNRLVQRHLNTRDP
jgi:hypothetical protein